MNFVYMVQYIFFGDLLGVGFFYLDNMFFFSECVISVFVEFCVDFFCELGFINVFIVVGSWNNFNVGVNVIIDFDEDGIYCGVVDLMLGFYEYKFYYQLVFEMLMFNQVCINVNVNCMINVMEIIEGVFLVVWESCVELVDCFIGMVIMFCVDLICENNQGVEVIVFDFNVFNFGFMLLVDFDGDGIWCNEFILELGLVEYNFFYVVLGMVVLEDFFGLDGVLCIIIGVNGVKCFYNVVDGVFEMVIFVWEFCDMSIVECFFIDVDIIFCVDVSCVLGVEDVSIFG